MYGVGVWCSWAEDQAWQPALGVAGPAKGELRMVGFPLLLPPFFSTEASAQLAQRGRGALPHPLLVKGHWQSWYPEAELRSADVGTAHKRGPDRFGEHCPRSELRPAEE
ncbi:hypothetical protein NDU88_005200 [Pleurodeles waltl]|uniref:Uncharacterized protein n=1 Tax=Pleurodeles waltl TaxID=8319 RepID=A0AAV7QGK2_PLEWA|nr:hypothetical protein NDU88_005200 [Pleurodeles waltl]